MSLNELAVDLTCVPVEFVPASSPPGEDMQCHDTHRFDDAKVPSTSMGKQQRRRAPSLKSLSSIERRPRYHVHGGMLRMARVMGEIGKPVHRAVAGALNRSPDYGSSTKTFHFFLPQN